MKISQKTFDENYHDASGFRDNWQNTIQILPVVPNTKSAYDKKSSLQSTVGQFIRSLCASDAQPIINFEQSVLKPVNDYLFQLGMPQQQASQFLLVVKDVFDINGHLNIADTSFFKYLPLFSTNEIMADRDKKKYIDGQMKMADYLISMLSDNRISFPEEENKNLFFNIVSAALARQTFGDVGKKNVNKYTVPEYIKRAFEYDLQWLLGQNEQIKIKYLHLLLHFYACYAITQTIFLLSSKKTEYEDLKKPEKLYFILSSEKISLNHDAVLMGWPKKIQERQTLEKLFGKIQALDIVNCLLNGPVGYYPHVLEKLQETPFEENCDALIEILRCYVKEKTDILHMRRTERDRGMPGFDPSVSCYEEFLQKLERCCIELQSIDYKRRMKKRVNDILRMRFLSSRRGKDVLVLDNEMLDFLIVITTKGEKIKLEEMYRRINMFGIYFNRGTRSLIEDYLLRLNLLDRKSDSGEVQYVRAIL